MRITIVFEFYRIVSLELFTSNDYFIHGIIGFKWLHTAYVDLVFHGRTQLLHSAFAARLYGPHRRPRAVNADRWLHPIECLYL